MECFFWDKDQGEGEKEGKLEIIHLFNRNDIFTCIQDFNLQFKDLVSNDLVSKRVFAKKNMKNYTK